MHGSPVRAFAAIMCMLTSFGVALADDLPTAETILDRYVEATGGERAYDRLNNRVGKGTISIPAMGIEGTIQLYSAKPNRSRTIMELAGLGLMEEGFDGTTAWDKNPMMGPRIKAGDEAAQVARNATFNAERNWRKVWKSVETTGEADVDGEMCYQVTLTPEIGNPQMQYFSKESGLLLKAVMKTTTQMGEVPVESLFSEYKESEGLTIPHRIQQSAGPQTFVITITDMLYNTDLPKTQFDLPEDVEALLEKEPSEG